MAEIVLAAITGKDSPGITVALTTVLSRYDIKILDIGQSVIHKSLLLGMLLEIPPRSAASPLFKELILKAHELDLTVRFSPVSEKKYNDWASSHGGGRHIITLLGREITARHIERISRIVADHDLNIEKITRLSGRMPLKVAHPEHKRASIEFSLQGRVADLRELHESFLKVSQELELDVSIQEDNVFRRNRRLICFDMDSTLIQTEVINELARTVGMGERVGRITESAMNGEIDFKESFKQRMALLQGIDVALLKKIARTLPITEGVDRLIFNLKRLGFKIAILSGGFSYFANHLGEKYGIDYVYANTLDIQNGKLTGKIVGEVIDGERKACLMTEIAKKEGLSLEQVVAVGDGANDLPMLGIAGMGVAFQAKPLVRRQARHSIATLGLDGILYLLGMSDRDIKDPKHPKDPAKE
ncbi:MAG: phosphoserine phosphatase SerB [Nitrospinota bacterium]